MAPDELRDILLQRKLIASRDASITPLSGGVSSDIFLVEDAALPGPDKRFVLKMALPKLRVKDDWFADVSRNRHEQDYIDYVGAFLPEAVPRILHRAPEHGFFTMEYLGGEFQNWKTMLLAGVHDIQHAHRAGEILGRIHSKSWGDPQAKRTFNTGRNFDELRIEPYLITTGQRHPQLQAFFEEEAKRLAATQLCLVHGDFSPKNILVGPRRMVLLDCEVAWFGDPAFDVAFILNHLCLKRILFKGAGMQLTFMTTQFLHAYLNQLSEPQQAHVQQQAGRLLLMLMLARIDGKSPVEYLRTPGQKNKVRRFVTKQLLQGASDVASVIARWLLAASR